MSDLPKLICKININPIKTSTGFFCFFFRNRKAILIFIKIQKAKKNQGNNKEEEQNGKTLISIKTCCRG